MRYLVSHQQYIDWCHEWALLPDWNENPLGTFRWGQYFINQHSRWMNEIGGSHIHNPELYFQTDPYEADLIILRMYVDDSDN